jgi:hypothetical protein
VQEDSTGGRSYSDAEAAADLARYHMLKRSVSIRSLSLVGLLGLILVWWLPRPALAIVVGGVCGVLNTWLTMRYGERLLDTKAVGGFVFSSFLRILVFGIVPVAFAIGGPWWSMGFYYVGFFVPLALFAFFASRR